MDAQLQKAYRFFRENAGYVVGERAKGALQLAKAEREVFDGFGWAYYTEPDFDPDLSWMSNEERDQPHECYILVLADRTGAVQASLGGIVDPTDSFLRVCAAEMALEACH